MGFVVYILDRECGNSGVKMTKKRRSGVWSSVLITLYRHTGTATRCIDGSLVECSRSVTLTSLTFADSHRPERLIIPSGLPSLPLLRQSSTPQLPLSTSARSPVNSAGPAVFPVSPPTPLQMYPPNSSAVVAPALHNHDARPACRKRWHLAAECDDRTARVQRLRADDHG